MDPQEKGSLPRTDEGGMPRHRPRMGAEIRNEDGERRDHARPPPRFVDRRSAAAPVDCLERRKVDLPPFRDLALPMVEVSETRQERRRPDSRPEGRQEDSR